jgi:hypothetical protein
MLDASALENVHIDHASRAPDEFVQKPPCRVFNTCNNNLAPFAV